MAITYNALEDLSHIFRYNGAYSADLAGETIFDYFDDDASVGDILYFGFKWKAKDIQVFIDTPFSADSVTFVWEYYNGAWVTLSVTDGTNNWTNTGEQTIEFTPPDDWRYYDGYLAGERRRFWVRCRISAISNPTEGGSNGSQKCQAGSNTILVTGYNSEETACSFTDISDADTAGGWGRFTKQGDSQFYLNCYLTIGDNETATYFIDISKQITIADKLMTYQGHNPIHIKKGSYFILGELLDAEKRTTRNGCDILSEESLLAIGSSYTIYGNGVTSNNWGFLRFYSCTFRGRITVGYASYSYFYNCFFDEAITGMIYGCYLSNVQFENASSYVIGSPTNAQLIQDIHIRNCGGMTYPSGTSGLVRDVVIVDTSKVARLNFNRILYAHNVTCDNWTFYWYLPTTAICYRYYSFDLKVQNINQEAISGATVTIVDVNGDAIAGSPFTTDANGDIAQQDILYGTYEQSDDLILKSPYTVTISKPGYKTRVVKYPSLAIKPEW